eukprot:scaffold96261_cov34-Tisochrysis_lutea.AAC.1
MGGGERGRGEDEELVRDGGRSEKEEEGSERYMGAKAGEAPTAGAMEENASPRAASANSYFVFQI